MKNRLTFNFKTIFLGLLSLITFSIIIIACFIDFEVYTTDTDMLLYRASGILFLLPIQISLLLEMNIFSLGTKISFLNSNNILKHILFWIITLLISCIVFAIPYSIISDLFKDKIRENRAAKSIVIVQDTKHKEPQKKLPTIKKQSISWIKLSENRKRYEHVLGLLGNHFFSKTYSDANYIGLNEEEKTLIKELYAYYNEHNTLPTDFTTTFTNFCVGQEFDSKTFWGNNDNLFYKALSKSFDISWKSNNTYHIKVKQTKKEELPTTEKFVTEDKPLTLLFNDKEYNVGTFSIKLQKIEIVDGFSRTGYQKQYKNSNQLNKGEYDLVSKTAYGKYFRIYATVTNHSSSVEKIRTTKPNSFFVGQYYGTQGAEAMGYNDHYHWKVNSQIKSSFEWTIPSYRTLDIVTTGLVVTHSDKFKYSDKPKFDLYFSAQDDFLTISINR